MMPTSTAQIIIFGGLVWICWKILTRIVRKSPLHNIPGPPSKSWVTGNLMQLLDRDALKFHDMLSEQYGAVYKLHMLVGSTALCIHDPKAIHNVTSRDDIYDLPDTVIEWMNIIIGPGLLSTKGSHHRKQRTQLNPLFSATHIRHITPMLHEVAERLSSALHTMVEDKETEVDMLPWMGRAALELVGQAGLGYSFDPLLEDKENEFGNAIKSFIPAANDIPLIRQTAPYWAVGPASIRRWILDRIPIAKIQKMKDICDVAERHSRELVVSKKEALEKGDDTVTEQISEGKDILSVLVKANLNASEDDRLPESEVVAQISTLVLASTDTTSNALSRILYLLAQNQNAQEKLRSELADERYGQQISYERLVELPYLDAVCRETLRVYPPVAFSMRDAREDATITLSHPIKGNDGTLIDSIFIPKGTSVITNIRGCQLDPAIWGEDAREWRPERWLSPLPATVTEAHIPGVYPNLMTFLGGSRACIGFRFAISEIKITLAVLLQRLRFLPTNKEVVWNLAGIPNIIDGEGKDKPSLPIVIEPITTKRSDMGGG